VNSLLPSRTHISTVFLLPERYSSPELRLSSCPPSSAASAASHPRSSALVALPQPTEAHRPVQFHFPALEQPGPQSRRARAPPPLGLAVVPTLRRLSAPAKHTTSTTSSRGSFLVTSPLLSCNPATGTPPSSRAALPPAPVHRRLAISAPLFVNTGHPP
jgi:hypothetical protein